MSALTVHNAEVHTATVEVKTLTISGKQVTLAVFRQLREESLITEAGILNGEPWGTVNYCPPKCAGGKHLHVVWQQDEELLRSTVRPARLSAEFYSDSADEYVQAAYCANDHSLPAGMTRRRGPDGPHDRCIGFVMSGIPCITAGEPQPEHQRDHRCSLNLSQERAMVTEDADAERARRECVNACFDLLSDHRQIPQLFIAV